ASCGAGDEERRRTSATRQGSIQPVLEQCGGAGPSESEATNPADAGIQAIRPCSGNDLRNRAGREDQEGAVQDGQTRRMPCDDDGTVERGTRSLSLIRNHSTRRSLIDFTVGLSLHQNHIDPCALVAGRLSLGTVTSKTNKAWSERS